VPARRRVIVAEGEKRNDAHNIGGHCPDDAEFGSPQIHCRMLGFLGLLDVVFVLKHMLRWLLVQLRRMFLRL